MSSEEAEGGERVRTLGRELLERQSKGGAKRRQRSHGEVGRDQRRPCAGTKRKSRFQEDWVVHKIRELLGVG